MIRKRRSTGETSDSEEYATRESIILAAEQLFAEQGIEGASLREINRLSAQRNKSAVQYHFKNREGLVAAIFDYRMERVNSAREALLAEMGDAPTVRQLVEATVVPMALEVENSAGGSHYARFLSAVSGHHSNDVRALFQSRHASGLYRINTLLSEALQDLPPEIRGMRFGLMLVQVIHALAERERLGEISRAGEPLSIEVYTHNLVDMLEAALAAPVSAQTRQATP